MVRQDSHLTHRPSVRTRALFGRRGCSIDFLSRLNQAMGKVDSRKFYKLKEETVHVAYALLSRGARRGGLAPLPSKSYAHTNNQSPAEPVYPLV